MNTLKKAVIQSPAELEEECASFIIDDVSSPFVLHNITTVGEKYTLSLWIRSDAEGSILVRGVTIPTTSEWSRHVVTYTANNTDLKFFFNTIDTYNIYHPKLEAGNKATDYTTAPEDVTDAIANMDDKLQTAITEQRTSIISDCESIMMSALENYVGVDEFGEFQESVSSELSLMAQGLELRITETTARIDDVNEDLQEQYNTITKYFSFEVNGLTIGAVDNPNKVVIDNDKIAIYVNETEVQCFDSNGNALIPELNVTRSMNLFGFIIDQDDAGNVNCEYRGG